MDSADPLLPKYVANFTVDALNMALFVREIYCCNATVSPLWEDLHVTLPRKPVVELSTYSAPCPPPHRSVSFRLFSIWPSEATKNTIVFMQLCKGIRHLGLLELKFSSSDLRGTVVFLRS